CVPATALCTPAATTNAAHPVVAIAAAIRGADGSPPPAPAPLPTPATTSAAASMQPLGKPQHRTAGAGDGTHFVTAVHQGFADLPHGAYTSHVRVPNLHR